MFDRLSIRFRNLWDLPLAKLDKLIEKEFIEYRKTLIYEEELYEESEKVVNKLEGLAK